MTTSIYWFRNDLRLVDNPALTAACARSSALVPVVCLPDAADLTRWNFPRISPRRMYFIAQTIRDLADSLATHGSGLTVLTGHPGAVLPGLARQLSAQHVFAEAIAAPQEEQQIDALRSSGISVETTWQSSLLDPEAGNDLPDVFTQFRQRLEARNETPPAPLSTPAMLPPLPIRVQSSVIDMTPIAPDPRSSFPFDGGATAALAHLAHYFSGALPRTYKQTRNALTGVDFSSKFSPWLATGALSPRTIYHALKHHESRHGANDGTYWLWFELLWRDYFRFLHCKYGKRLYRSNGLNQDASKPSHDEAAFQAWREGRTGEPLVDAAMRELAATGYLSNRLRQLVASYAIHDLKCDWRAGAAWFESQLLDYDVYSNQGNWLYIAGLGTDPRGGRRFNATKQTRDHDPDGVYRALWSVQ